MVALVVLAAVTSLNLPSSAQVRYPLVSKDRLALNVTTGYLGFKSYGDGVKPWNGVDVSSALSYNVGSWTAVALVDHGFPIQSDGHRTLARAYLNLKTSEVGQWDIYVGGGVLAMGEVAPRDWAGPEGHITASYKISRRLFWSGTYSHAFSTREDQQGDFDFYRVALVAKVAP